MGRTDAAGRFQVTSEVLHEPFRICVLDDDHFGLSGPLPTMQLNDVETRDLELTPTRAIYGRIAGRGVLPTFIELHSEEVTAGRLISPDDDGSWSFQRAPRRLVVIQAEGCKDLSVPEGGGVGGLELDCRAQAR